MFKTVGQSTAHENSCAHKLGVLVGPVGVLSRTEPVGNNKQMAQNYHIYRLKIVTSFSIQILLTKADFVRLDRTNLL